ncbi:MAG: mannitol dehydrogenase family protein [Candidatus Puniceispirillaceae bacterium]
MSHIVHIGVGNFHRAHQADYIAKANGWTMSAVVMSNAGLLQHMQRYDYRYLLGIWGNDGLDCRLIDAYQKLYLAGRDEAEIIEDLASEATKIVTLTITEKGYFLNKSQDGLSLVSAPVSHDLQFDHPQTAIGMMAKALHLRAMTHQEPVSLLSCDNLVQNGQKLQMVLRQFMHHKYPACLPWFDLHVACPNAMVDRITPKPDKQAMTDICAKAGLDDFPVVVTEAFSEWVIEDKFANDRPELERYGVEFTPDVSAFEDRKLRMLNAAHSYLAYAGLLSGYQFIHEAMADRRLNSLVSRLWEEAVPTLKQEAARSSDRYAAALRARFAVSAMRHQCAQIAIDGSLKMTQRLVPIITNRHYSALSSLACYEAVAAWLAYVYYVLSSGDHLDDGHADDITAMFDASDSKAHFWSALLSYIQLDSAHHAPIIQNAATLYAQKQI